MKAALALHDVFSLLHALLGRALIFADEAAPERALELYALTQKHRLRQDWDHERQSGRVELPRSLDGLPSRPH
jgi:hypothetical protein